jgi:hypothetical protein
MGFNRLLSLLDHFSMTSEAEAHANIVLEGILSALSNKLNTENNIAALTDRRLKLQKFVSIFPTLIAAKHILSVAIQASLPTFHDGVFLPLKNAENLSQLVAVARLQWSRGINRSAELVDIEAMLKEDKQNSYDLDIISAAIYTSRSAQEATRRWILSTNVSAWPIETTTRILYAYFDSSDATNIIEQDQALLADHYARVFAATNDKVTGNLCTRLLSLISRLPLSLVEGMLASWDAKKEYSVYLLLCLAHLPDHISGTSRNAIGRMTQHASKWIIACLSSNDEFTQRSHDVLLTVSHIVRRYRCIDPQSAEALVMTAVQFRLQDPIVLSMVDNVLEGVQLKVSTLQ